MKVEYSATSSISWTTLGDEADRSALVELFAPSFAPLNQVTPLAGGTNTFKAPRGNINAGFQLVITIPYATTAAALEAVRTIKDLFATAKKHFRLTQGATVHYYPSALLNNYSPVLRGVTVTHNLSFTSDDLTTTAPT